jgi:hypothetical protein
MAVPTVGDLLPHFQATDLAGTSFVYSVAAWQRRNLVLVRLPAEPSGAEAGYLAALAARAGAFEKCAALLLVTRDELAGMPGAGVVVADRWGEIFHVAHAADVASLPPAEALVDWVDFVQRQCPECRAEAK